MALTPDQEREVRVLVGGGAWSAALPLISNGLLNLGDSLAVHGNPYDVAADVLDAVASVAREQAAGQGPQVKRLKVGPLEVEKATGNASALGAAASEWAARAASLRAKAVSASRQESSGSEVWTFSVSGV